MTSFVKKIGAALVAAAMIMTAACSGGNNSSVTESADSAAAQPAASHGGWDELDSRAITAAMGMGWNLGNQLEASSNRIPSETAWGNPTITEDLIKLVKEQGFGTVRIPVSYLGYIGEGPDYTIDSAWLDRVQEVVNYAVDNDMFAIINIHGDGYYTVDGGWLLCMDDNQDEIKAKYEAVWRQIAERFRDYDEHLIFESMNEVFDDTYGDPKAKGYENINAYNRIFVDTVRATGGNNDKRWVLMPGWNTNVNYTAGDYGFVIPEDSGCTSDGKRIMISVHYYDPYNFTLDESMSSATTQWGKYAVEKYDSWGQEDHVDQQMQLLNEKFVSRGYPVVIGEMGTHDNTLLEKNNTEFRRYWAEYIVKTCKAQGIIPVWWDNGYNGRNGFALFNRSILSVTQPEIIEGMMRAINSDGDYDIPAVDLPADDTAA